MFQGLYFTPRWPLSPILTSSLTSHLVLQVLATASVANKSNLVLAQSVRSNPDCLQTVLLPVLSSGTNLISFEPLNINNITIHSILAIRL